MTMPVKHIDQIESTVVQNSIGVIKKVLISLEIQHAMAEVEGVTGQNIEVVNFALAEELTKWLKQAFKKP
jgi:hypothetical protein